jgi:hypothetical protein
MMIASVSLSLGEQISVTLITGFVPAIIASFSAYILARSNSEKAIDQLKYQFDLQHKGQLQSFRQKYVSPLGYWAARLMGRITELEQKMENGRYDQVKGWFKILKDHTARDQRHADFPLWTRYEGIFATTTLYYTCSYFQSVWSIDARSPLSEIDPRYANQLRERMRKVTEAFGGEFGLWDSSQIVIGELFSDGEGKTQYAEMCRVLDGGDPFAIGAYLRPIDFYLDLNKERIAKIKPALEELVKFVNAAEEADEAASRARAASA